MNKKEYKNIYVNEGSHFYYVATHNLVLSLVKKYLPITNNKSPITILDAGCGTGLLAKKLEQFGKVTGVDYSFEAIKNARKRKLNVVKASIDKLPFPDNSFSIVTSVDVIYHEWVEDDQKALNEMYRVLRPGGILILKVPALKWLKLGHDKFVYTKRRYDKNELREKMEKAGFKIEKITYINIVLLKLALMKYIIESIHHSEEVESNVTKLPGLINQIATTILNIEYALAMKIDFPIGMGLIAVGRK